MNNAKIFWERENESGEFVMNTEYYKKFEPVFNSWYIKRLLGEGSYGKVFEIDREDFGTTYKSALKAMTIPSSESEVKSVMADGMDEKSVRDYYENFVEDIVKEFVLMSKLKGNSNIVSYEDHMVIEHKDKIGWDILIRMELLTPLFDYVKSVDLRRKDVIKLGIDMCKALELCQKYNIIHRDIKPENIFVSENGDFKLGDFGIARTLEQTSGMLSKKGTQAYMAPEIYREESYGSNVDIYSLGIVMYRLLNENRTPFLPAYPAPITHSDRESAIKKRISGAPLPKPSNADGRLAEIVLKACSYDPKERYFSPMEMRKELEAILYNKEEAKIIYPKGDETPIKSIKYIRTGDEIPEVKTANRTDDMIDGITQEKTSGTDGIWEGRKADKTDGTEGVWDKKETESTKGTEGLWGRKKSDLEDKTESGFESQWETDDSKTEGMFGKRALPKKKKTNLKKPVICASAAAVAIACAAGGYFLIPHKAPETVTCSVASIAELTEPIEAKIDVTDMPDSDYDKIVNRLEAYGKKYCFNRTDGTLSFNKSDFGNTYEDIIGVLHMLVRPGNTVIGAASEDTNVLGAAQELSAGDIESAEYKADENCIYININESGKSKSADFAGKKVYAVIDDTLRCSEGSISGDGDKIIIKCEYNVMGFAPTGVADTSTENYLKLLATVINGGALTKEYNISIDEKYGITPSPSPTPEPVAEVTPMPAPADNGAQASASSSQTAKSSGKKTQQTAPKSNQSTPQQPAQQPVQQPAQQPVQQQPAQQSSSGNSDKLPEFYVDFD